MANALVIEDELTSQKILSTMLEQEGYQVQTCIDGSEGLLHYLAAPNKFDIIFLDLGLPEVSGYEFLKIISVLAKKKAIPTRKNVFIESGVANLKELNELIDHPLVLGVMSKPLNSAEITRVLRFNKETT